MEKYNDWIIDEQEITHWFLSNGRVKYHATIFPDIEELHDFLVENKIYSAYYFKNTLMGTITWYFEPRRIHNYYEKDEICMRNKAIFNAMQDFCKTLTYETTQKAYSYVDTGSMARTKKRAMDKIKDWIRENLPNPRAELIAYLKNRKLIGNTVNPFCEILNKDI